MIVDDKDKDISGRRRIEVSKMKSELQIAIDFLKEIAASCPIINKDKDAMHGKDAARLFAESTTRRMELAKEALERLVK